MNATLRAEDRLIFALDVDDEDRARALVRRLRPHVGLFKMGLETLMAGGMARVARLAEGHPVFVDAKLHDVPATVARSVRQIVKGPNPVRYITVHNCVREAVEACEGRAAILRVTVLTSIEARDLGGQEALTARVLRRAEEAVRAGAEGVICAPAEVRAVRAALGRDVTVVTPGVRPAWAAVAGDDQARTASPEEAVRAGADRVVVGRPIRDAERPEEAARRIVEALSALGSE